MVSVMRFVLLFSLLFGAPSLAMAKSDDAGSLYSRFGLGELQAFSSSQIQGLGGARKKQEVAEVVHKPTV